jgi:uncharacterized protein (TIGR00251 family)
VSRDDRALTLEVQVVPRASREQIGPKVAGRLKVRLTAAPTDGAANEALVRALATAIGVPRRQVTIIAGATSRKKTVRIEGASREAVEQLGASR